MKWTPEKAKLDWFIEGRFGMFIHWGLYALSARGTRSPEWAMSENKIPQADYMGFFKQFNPDLYKPEQWARVARESGMKYFVITAKHHDGFCLWDSNLTEYKVTNTPLKKDLLKTILEAFRNEGLKAGLYYSLLDWHHPDFPVDQFHPRRDYRELNQNRSLEKYTEYSHGQIRELLTKYGKIDYLFFDFSYPDKVWGGKGAVEWKSEELEDMILDLMPDILINDRLNLGRGVRTPQEVMPSIQPNKIKKANQNIYQSIDDALSDGDRISIFGSGNFEVVDKGEKGENVIWEACQSMMYGGAWGYERDNLKWKSSGQLIKMLIATVAKGGNMLLNVGPTGRGIFDAKSLTRLKDIGEWMRLHGRSIYNAGKSPYKAPDGCRFTQKGNKLYLHFFAWPFKYLHLKGLAGKVEYAQLLNDSSEIPLSNCILHYKDSKEGVLQIELPVEKPDVEVPVVELFLKKTNGG